MLTFHFLSELTISRKKTWNEFIFISINNSYLPILSDLKFKNCKFTIWYLFYISSLDHTWYALYLWCPMLPEQRSETVSWRQILTYPPLSTTHDPSTQPKNPCIFIQLPISIYSYFPIILWYLFTWFSHSYLTMVFYSSSNDLMMICEVRASRFAYGSHHNWWFYWNSFCYDMLHLVTWVSSFKIYITPSNQLVLF